MLLTITTTHSPATDLGYLLHKHPEKCQAFELSCGLAHVYYPEANSTRCTAALLVDIDPVNLVRGKSKQQKNTIDHYVNDRPYVASSFLSVAIAQVFRTALSGQCKALPELAETAIPLTANLPVLACRHGGENFLRELFQPLGYQVTTKSLELDEKFPDWGDSYYFSVKLEQTIRLSELLSHLYVLIPVLDDEKHYWIGDDEVDKLLRYGERWLANHPSRTQITKRYLKRQGYLTRLALKQLTEEDNPDPDAQEAAHSQEEEKVEKPISLNQQRLETVRDTLKAKGAKRIIDLGCGSGKLLRLLLQDNSFEKITGLDVSYRSLEIAQERLHIDRLPKFQQDRLQLIQGSLTYRDQRLQGYDAATLIEVIEHLDPGRLATLERVLFEFTQPQTVLVTTPNIEYNIRFNTLTEGKLRHQDHRFEWTRKEFQHWANTIAQRFNYTVEFQAIGLEDLLVGSPTQMAIFCR